MFDLLSKNDMVNTMDKTMLVSARRQGLVASNLSNIDTPGYRTRDFPFHEVLKDVLDGEGKHRRSLPMARTSQMHMFGDGTRPLPYAIDKAITMYERNDANDVNLDKEGMKLMQMQGTYSQAALFTQTALKRVFGAIREGAK
jgi:flagellar basal-body rod protein FlgB